MTDISTILKRFGLPEYGGAQEGRLVLFEVIPADLAQVMTTLYRERGLRLKTIAASDERAGRGSYRIHYVFGVPGEDLFLVPFISVSQEHPEFPSMTPIVHECSVYEQEIKTFFGLTPVGHPGAARIILHRENFPEDIYPLRKDFAWDTEIAPITGKSMPEMPRFEGEGVYEIPVGPVHAGIIEPGHFRFSVLGEEILRLAPRLGYVHKGTEKLFEHLGNAERLKLAERISGDSSFHHALAFAQAVETMAGTEIPERARMLRTVFAELERMANHFNDIAFIMLDTGLSFGGSHGTRLRERVMQWNERLTGSRFLRGTVALGGVTKDIAKEIAEELQDDLETLEKDFMEVMDVVRESDSLENRLRGTGRLDQQIGRDHGAVGIAARAIGEAIDARSDYPYAAYDMIEWSVPTEVTGDVRARFQVRVKEVFQSFRILNQILTLLPHREGAIRADLAKLPADAHAVGIVEGWRGDIAYFVMTDQDGEISRVKVRDPSFLNWQVFPYVVTNDIVPDFPLINKSFNLSYTGNDL